MNLLGRFAVLVMGLLLVSGFSVTMGAGPASATVSTLCSGYTACAKAGMSNSGYSSWRNTMYWRMYGGHNCTNYAAYRMVQSGLPNSRPWTGSGNATNWGSAMSRITDGTPAVGAIAWWRAGVRPAGSSGHVAYVEQVVSANEIIVSQDSWNGDFSWARITRTSTGWPSGFIHFSDVRVQNTAAPTVTGTARVGSELSASPGLWNPSSATVTYQWMQDGAAISGATGSTMSLTQAQQGKRITVRVGASSRGAASASAVSIATATVTTTAVARAAPVIRVDTTPGVRRLGVSATVQATGVSAVAGTLQVRSQGKLIRAVPVQAGVARTTVTGLPRGARTYRFWFIHSPTVSSGMVSKRLRIR